MAGPERRTGIRILSHRVELHQVSGIGLLGEPRGIVFHQGFAIGKAQQGGAVVDLRGKAIGGQLRLLFGNCGEPRTEARAILLGVEAEEIGRSVSVAIRVIRQKPDGKTVGFSAPVKGGHGTPGVDWSGNQSVQRSTLRLRKNQARTVA